MKNLFHYLVLLFVALSLWGCESDDYKALEGAIKTLDVAFKDHTRDFPVKPFVLFADSEARKKAPDLLAKYHTADSEFVQAAGVPRLQASSTLGQAVARLAQAEIHARLGEKPAAEAALAAAKPLVAALSEARESLDARQRITLAGVTSYYWWISSNISTQAFDEKINSIRWAIRGLEPKALVDYSGMEVFSPEHLRFIGARACAAFGHHQLIVLGKNTELTAEHQELVAELRTDLILRLQDLQKLLAVEPATQILYYRAELSLEDIEHKIENGLSSGTAVPFLSAENQELESALVGSLRLPGASENSEAIRALIAQPQFRKTQPDGSVMADPKTWPTLREKLSQLCKVTPGFLDQQLYVQASNAQVKLACKDAQELTKSLNGVGAMVKEFASQLLDLKLDKDQNYKDSPAFQELNRDLKPDGTFFKLVNTLKGELVPLVSLRNSIESRLERKAA